MINKQNTTRFAPGGVGGASRAVDSIRSTRTSTGAEEAGVRAIWEEVRKNLRRRLGEGRYDAWIARLELIAEVNGEVLVAAQGELEYDRVTREFIRDIQHAWSQADTADRKVRLDVRN